MNKRCPTCSAGFGDPMAWFLHVSTCTSKTNAQAGKYHEKQDPFGTGVTQLHQRTDGHKSWVRGSKPRKQSKLSRSERIALYADNARRNDRGLIVSLMPDVGGEFKVLYGQTKLDQAGLAKRLLVEEKQRALGYGPRPQPKEFGAGVY